MSRPLLRLFACAACIACIAYTSAADGHPFATLDNHDGGGTGAINLVAADGSITWTHPIPGGRDLWALPNGNVLYSCNGQVEEIARDHTTVFLYTAPKEIHSCQRLPDGNTLIAIGGPARLVEVKPDGTVAHEIPLTTAIANAHDQMRMARRTPEGTYVVAHNGDRVVRTYDRTGKVLRELKVPVQVHGLVPLADQGLLITGNNGPGKEPAMIEYDAAGTEVWRVGARDLPGITFKWMSGVQRLPNGNTVLCQWLGHKQMGTGPHLVEITRDKRVVWMCTDHERFKTLSTVQYLDVPWEQVRR
jgi:hypothetical protein